MVDGGAVMDAKAEQKSLIDCPHRYSGCISQNGYMCTNGPVCQPVDSNGRRFVVHEWIENGQRLSTREYLDYGELAPPQKKPVADVIDSEAMNSRLLASHNPREALTRIRYLAHDAKQHLRNGNEDKAFAALNQIGWLTGAVS